MLKLLLTIGFILSAVSISAQPYNVFVNKILVQNEGVNLLPQFWIIDFIGDGVDCITDTNNGKVKCTITGGGPGGGASTANTYITQTPAADLINEQALSLLTTGLLKNTTGTGVLSIGSAGVDYAAVAHSHLDAEVDNGITLTNITQITNRAISDTSGTLTIVRGGTGLTGVALNQLFVGTGVDTFTAKTLPSCSNLTTSKLLYNDTTQTFSCGTDQTGGGGGAPTDAQYWVGAADATLSAEKDLSGFTGLVLNTAGTPSGYAGTSCTNQFARSFNGSGAATCNSVAGTDFASQTANFFFAAPNGSVGSPSFRAVVDDDIPDTISLTNITQITNRAISDTSGTLAVTRGGTGLAAVADDEVYVGTAVNTLTAKTLPPCSNATTSKLLYDATTNAFSCGTDQSSSGAIITRISGSSGAASGADIVYLVLTADSADNTSTTPATFMTVTGLATGTYSYKVKGFYQTAATTTGISFAVNFTGTVTAVAALWFNVTTGGAAATGVGDSLASTNTGQLVEGKSGGGNNVIIGSASAGVDTINTSIIFVIEGLFFVTASGNLEIKAGTEVGTSAIRIKAGTVLELQKIS